MGAANAERHGRQARDLVGLTSEGESLAEGGAASSRFRRRGPATLDPDERAELVRLTEKATVALRTRSEELAAR